MTKIPNRKENRLGHFGSKFGICLGFGICNLVTL